MLGRLTERPGSSAFLRGGIVAYSNDVKEQLAGVPGGADRDARGGLGGGRAGARRRRARAVVGADIGIGVTGVAGPDGGRPEKPVGLVWVALRGPDGRRIVRRTDQRGTRADVRERTTTATLHLLRRLLLGESDPAPA